MIEALTERINAAGQDLGIEGTWLRVVEELLRLCRDREPALHAAVAAQRGTAELFLSDVQREAAALLTDCASGQVHPVVAHRLCELVRHHAERWEGPAEQCVVLIARALSLAIDERLHEVFLDRFRTWSWSRP